MKLTEDEEVVVVVVVSVVSDVLSSGFDSPKVNPPLEELLSVLDDPVPNTIPPLVPNLDQPAAGSGFDFLSSLEAVPNLKPSDELPNLNPDAAVVSLEVVSGVELPNLNPPDGEEDSENEPPNLKPPDPDPDPDPEVLSEVPNLNPPDMDTEVLSDVPNLKPPEVEEPNVEEPVAPAADEPKALGSTLAPGLAVWQATHCTSAALFCTRQTSHSQAPSGFLNASPNPNTGAVLTEEEAASAVPVDAPGLALEQATHFVSSALFCTKQVSHSHVPSGFLKLSPNPMRPVVAGTVGVDTVFTAAKAEGRVSEGLSPVPGLAVSQATHFTASDLFITRHVSQSQVPAGLENIVPKPVFVVVVEVVFVLLLSSPTTLTVDG